MIIDIHTHAWPEKVSGKVREGLESFFGVPFMGEPTVATLLRSMEQNAIDLSVISGVATKAEQVPAINDWLFGVRGPKLRVFCALHPEYAGWREEIARIAKNGDGVKFHPEFQNFYVDEERLGPFYAALEEAALPVLFHCGEELSGTLTVLSSPSRIAKVKEAYPRLKLIAGHFGGFKVWQEAEAALLGKDIYLDTSFFFRFLPRAVVRRLLLSHRKDRLLFGTDFPLAGQKEDIEFLRSLALPKELEERIFYRNALELFEAR